MWPDSADLGPVRGDRPLARAAAPRGPRRRRAGHRRRAPARPDRPPLGRPRSTRRRPGASARRGSACACRSASRRAASRSRSTSRRPPQGGLGPHGLIVGATGSGKSELLRTLVAGLARGPPAGGPLLRPDRLQGRQRLRRAGAPAARRRPDHQPPARRAAWSTACATRCSASRSGARGCCATPATSTTSAPTATAREQRPVAGADAAPARGGGRVRRAAGGAARVHRPVPGHRPRGPQPGHAPAVLEPAAGGGHACAGSRANLRYRICLRTYSAAESKIVLGTPDAYLLPPVPRRRLPEGGHRRSTSASRSALVSGSRAEAPRAARRRARAWQLFSLEPARRWSRAEPRGRRTARARRARRTSTSIVALLSDGPRRRAACTRSGCRRWPTSIELRRAWPPTSRGGSATDGASPRAARRRSGCWTCPPSSAPSRSCWTSRAAPGTWRSWARRRAARAPSCARSSASLMRRAPPRRGAPLRHRPRRRRPVRAGAACRT